MNPLYFPHCGVNSIHITINGNTVYTIRSIFPSQVTQAYYETQKGIGLERENMISYDSFTSGRTVFSFSFVSEDMKEALPVEMSASMRISIRFSNPLSTPHVVMLFGDTTGILSIDSDRIVHCDVRG